VLDPIVTTSPDILRFERKVRVLPASRRRVSPSPDDADTIRCQEGDTLLVTLLGTAPIYLDHGEVDNPIPAGATPVDRAGSKLHMKPSPMWLHSIRDDGLELSAYLSPYEKAFEHTLIADRTGTFQMPGARLHLKHLPMLQATSSPLVVAISPRSDQRR
jgi:uncharacterized protein YfaS (alpha-2-macroglobulin family)